MVKAQVIQATVSDGKLTNEPKVMEFTPKYVVCKDCGGMNGMHQRGCKR